MTSRSSAMCRSTLTDEQITALITGIKDRQPKTCPCCGSADIFPTFEPVGGDWECLRCCVLWSHDE